MEQKKTLSSLVSTELQIIQKLYDSAGEITPEISELMSANSKDLPMKVDAYSYRMDRIDMEIEFLRMKKDEIDIIIKSMTNAKTWLKDNIKNSMNILGVTELSGEDRRFKLSSSAPKVDIFNEEDLPSTFVRETIIHEPDKEKIKLALNRGEEVPGARLLESQSLRVYPAKRSEK